MWFTEMKSAGQMLLAAMMTAAVIGLGTMGHGIAQVFALHGYAVGLMDIKQELLPKAIENIRTNLTLKAEHGIGSMEDIEPAIERISTSTEMAEAAAGAQFVVEAVLDGTALKTPLSEGLGSVALANAMLLSAWEDRRVSLPLDAEHYQSKLDERIARGALREPMDLDVHIDMDASYR